MSHRKTVLTCCIAVVLCLFVAGGAAAASGSATPGPAPTPAAFPTAGMDLVTHQITVDLHRVGPGGVLGNVVETLVFDGRMILERGDAYVNGTGHRQIDFVVTSWQADAWSNALNTMVTYRLADDIEQEAGSITAEQTGSDYPASILFHVDFDAYAYGMIFKKHHKGRPHGHHFLEMPPTGNRLTSPTITTFDTGLIEMDHPTLGRLRLVPRDCNDRSGKTLVTYTDEQKSLLKTRTSATTRKASTGR